MKKHCLTLTTIFFLFCSSIFADTKNLVFNESYDFRNIDSITISLTYENLKINQIYGDEIVVEIGSNNIKKIPQVTLNDELEYEDSFKNLEIKSTVKKASPGTSCTVYLYLPQDFLPDRMNISLVSGNLQAENLRSQNTLYISNVSGRTDIASSSTDFLKLTSISGNVTMQKLSAGYFDMNNVSGNIFVELENSILAKSYITTVSGKIQVYYKKNESPFLDDSPDFIISSVSGKIETKPFD